MAKKRLKPSRESHMTRYYKRVLKRLVGIIVWLFVLYVVIMGFIWAAPRIWNFVLG